MACGIARPCRNKTGALRFASDSYNHSLTASTPPSQAPRSPSCSIPTRPCSSLATSLVINGSWLFMVVGIPPGNTPCVDRGTRSVGADGGRSSDRKIWRFVRLAVCVGRGGGIEVVVISHVFVKMGRFALFEEPEDHWVNRDLPRRSAMYLDRTMSPWILTATWPLMDDSVEGAERSVADAVGCDFCKRVHPGGRSHVRLFFPCVAQ